MKNLRIIIMLLVSLTFFSQCSKPVSVESVSLNKTSLVLAPGKTETLVATILPANATNKNVTWTTIDPEVAMVDALGLVTAKKAGAATIIVTTGDGGKIAMCNVDVSSGSMYPLGDGTFASGVEVAGIVWAPVNCGYKAKTGDEGEALGYRYGKLYQWGRKYGQGYSGYLFINGKEEGTISDATYPIKEDGTLINGQVSFVDGNSESNKNIFYYGNINWCTESFSEWSHSKGNDPCPAGWRLPTKEELELLSNGKRSGFIADDSGIQGYYFTGNNDYSADLENKVFFPATACRDNNNGNAIGRGNYGCYWSSSLYNENFANRLYFVDDNVCMDYIFSSFGFSVRCVEE